jgi:hypothetical protein
MIELDPKSSRGTFFAFAAGLVAIDSPSNSAVHADHAMR